MPDQFPHPYTSLPGPDPSKIRSEARITPEFKAMLSAAQILIEELPAELERQRAQAKAIGAAAPYLHAALHSLMAAAAMHLPANCHAMLLARQAMDMAKPKGMPPC